MKTISLRLIIQFAFCFSTFAADVKPRIMDPINAPVSQFPYAAKLAFTLANTPSGYIDFGSGVLIAPRLVLTAGHCAYDPQSHSGITSMAVTIDGTMYTISNYFVHPTWSASVGQTNTEGVVDAAILVLSSAPPVTPMPIYRGDIPLGTQLTLIGFGQTGNGFTGQIQGSGPPLGTVNYGFTSVESIGFNYMHWTYRLGEQTTAHGDSGGPGLVTIPQMNGYFYKVAGLCESGQDPTLYGQQTNELVVRSFSVWIDSVAGFTNVQASSFAQHPRVMYYGESIAIDTYIANNSVNGSHSFDVSYRLSKTGSYSSGDQLLLYGFVANGLPQFSNQEQIFTGLVPLIQHGAYYLTSLIDPEGSLFESDYTDNYYSDPAPVVILDEISSINHVKSFGVNYKSTGKDSLKVTFELPSSLQFESKSAFDLATDNKEVAVFVGGSQIDTQFVFNGRGYNGTGHLTWNYKKGTIQYTTTRAELKAILAPYGVSSTSVPKIIQVPIWFGFNGILYGSEGDFLFTNHSGRTGTGK